MSRKLALPLWLALVLIGCPLPNEVIDLDYSDVTSLEDNKAAVPGRISNKGESIFYQFSVKAGTRYYIEWKDKRNTLFKNANENAISQISVYVTYSKGGSNILEGSRVRQTFMVDRDGYIFIEVKASNGFDTGKYEITLRKAGQTDRIIFEAPEVSTANAGITLIWTPPAEVTYQNIYRKLAADPDENANWVLIGVITRENVEESFGPGERTFIDYSTDYGEEYDYVIEGGYHDSQLNDWRLYESDLSEPITGVGGTLRMPDKEEHTVTYREEDGTLTFTPPFPRTNSTSYGAATLSLGFWDEVSAEYVYIPLNTAVSTYTVNSSMFPDYFIQYPDQPFYLDCDLVYQKTSAGFVTSVSAGSFTTTGAGWEEQDIVIPMAGDTVTGVGVSPYNPTVNKGGTQQFTAAVYGPDNPSQAVTWSVNGNSSSGTTITSSGFLTVGSAENASTLTVTATSTVNTSMYGTTTVTVSSGTGSVTNVTVSPQNSTVNKGGTQQFTATVNGSSSTAVYWSVTGNSSSNTYITYTGILWVASNETASTLRVTATSTVDYSTSGTATVTVSSSSGSGVPGIGTSMTNRTWSSNYLTMGGTDYYYFYAQSGYSYDVYWDDYDTTSSYADIKVSALWYINGRFEAMSSFIDIDAPRLNNYCGKTITADRTGYIVLAVEGYLSSSSGYYRIQYDR